MEALAIERVDLNTVTAELRKSQRIRTNLKPDTQFHDKPDDYMCAYSVAECRWCGPVTVFRKWESKLP